MNKLFGYGFAALLPFLQLTPNQAEGSDRHPIHKMANDTGIVTALPTAVRLAAVARGPSGKFRLRVSGSAGQTYTLQASADLKAWTNLVTTTSTTSTFDLVDANAIGVSIRFYRILQ